MRNFRVKVEYDGTDLSGFQLQAGPRTVQGDLEAALARLTGAPVRVHGAGRTDAGVHALGQVIGFRADTRIPAGQMCAAINSGLRADIRAVRAEEVGEEFHARFSASARRYAYVILNRSQPSAVFGRFSWWVDGSLDVEAMKQAAGLMVGTRDFRAWAARTDEVRTTVRTVVECRLRRAGPFLLVSMEANGFLRGMVRAVVGTLVQVGQGKRPASDIEAITAALQRSFAGPSAPANGLCLTKVRYGSPQVARVGRGDDDE